MSIHTPLSVTLQTGGVELLQGAKVEKNASKVLYSTLVGVT